MKVVILAGGRGTRICEETVSKPKPMVSIGEMPILWHIMKIYSSYGLNDFIICLGYKGEMIMQFFSNYELRLSDVTFDMQKGTTQIHRASHEPWRVTLVNTGLDTATGGRLRRVREYLDGEPFCFTYGDGLSDVNIPESIEFHRRQQKLVTMTVSRHTSRFGVLKIHEDTVEEFVEKPVMEGSWMNSGFYVMDPRFIDCIEDDDTVLEGKPIQNLVGKGQLAAFKHYGFFRGMDAMRDKIELEELWKTNSAPWKKWGDGNENLRFPGDRRRNHRDQHSARTAEKIFELESPAH